MNILSKRAERLVEPSTLLMARLTANLREKGVDVISLSLGEPDFDTPEHICKAAVKAIEDGYTHYSPVSGYVDLKMAIINKFKNDNGLHYSTENIVVSTGAKQALMNIILCIINDGDEVLVPAPFWVSYPEIIKIAGGIPVIIPTTMENNQKVSATDIEAKITNKTKAIIFSSPSNPSGAFYTLEELNSWAEVLKKHENIIIISDEIYEHLNYESSHVSIAQIPELFHRVVVVNGVSKSFAMTGWRLGYMGAPAWLASACDKMQGQITSGASSISQRAALSALSSPLDSTYAMSNAFKKRRNLTIEKMKQIPGIKYNIPQGAYYVFPDMSYFFGKNYNGFKIENADDLSFYFLQEARVSVVSGIGFGDNKCIRISFANSEENIEEAWDRIIIALNNLS
jgi:aspartate aminotransferase